MMKGLMDKLGVTCTKIKQLDFTKTTSEDFKFDDESEEIDVLFLDPSCSGLYFIINLFILNAMNLIILKSK